jgi:hypothetical protein
MNEEELKKREEEETKLIEQFSKEAKHGEILRE